MLEGLRVVECATVIAAPMTCACLADMGATVIKIEPPNGDMWRHINRAHPTWAEEPYGPLFANNNRGKRSVVVDLTADGARASVVRLLREQNADVFVTNLPPYQLKKYKIDFESLRAEVPRVIYAQLSAFGSSGPGASRPGYDTGAFWAATGLMDIVKPSDDPNMPPARFPGGIGDAATSQMLLAGIGLALYHRERTGRGQRVDVSLLQAGIFTMALPLIAAAGGTAAEVRATRAESSVPLMQPYRTKDGVWLNLLCLDWKRWWPLLVDALGLEPALATDARLALPVGGLTPEERRRVVRLFDAAFASRVAAEWEATLTHKKISFQRVMRFEEVLGDAQAEHLGALTALPGSEALCRMGRAFSALPISFSDVDAGTHRPRGPAPLLGEATAQLLGAPRSSKL